MPTARLTWEAKYSAKQADPDERPIYMTWDEIERAAIRYSIGKPWRKRLTPRDICDLLNVRLVGE